MNAETGGGLTAEVLAERLYKWSGGIFWRGEFEWQDRYREEARQWFAYSDLVDALADRDAALARVEALLRLWDEWDGARPHPGESSPRQRDQLRAALHPAPRETP